MTLLLSLLLLEAVLPANILVDLDRHQMIPIHELPVSDGVCFAVVHPAERQALAPEMAHLVAIASHPDPAAFNVMEVAREAADTAALHHDTLVNVPADVLRQFPKRLPAADTVLHDEADEERDELPRRRLRAVGKGEQLLFHRL